MSRRIEPWEWAQIARKYQWEATVWKAMTSVAFILGVLVGVAFVAILAKCP